MYLKREKKHITHDLCKEKVHTNIPPIPQQTEREVKNNHWWSLAKYSGVAQGVAQVANIARYHFDITSPEKIKLRLFMRLVHAKKHTRVFEKDKPVSWWRGAE